MVRFRSVHKTYKYRLLIQEYNIILNVISTSHADYMYIVHVSVNIPLGAYLLVNYCIAGGAIS